MDNKEALNIVSAYIDSCRGMAEDYRAEARDEPSEYDRYMGAAVYWEERAEAFGIVLGIAKEAMKTE